MLNWWDENVWFPRYANDWWFIGGIVLAFVFAIFVGYASSEDEKKREQRLSKIESKIMENQNEI